MNAALTSASWYAARGTGVVSLVLLTVVVALGIATRSGRPLPGLPRFAVAAIHRSASLLAVVLLAVHVSTLLVDHYAKVSLVDVVVPFLGSHRPLWQGMGTIALDLVLTLVLTSLLRARIGARTWRAVHWAAYAAWPVALAHGLGNGTDAGTGWMRATAAGCVAVVGAALTWRVSAGFEARRGARRTTSGPLAAPVTTAETRPLERAR